MPEPTAEQKQKLVDEDARQRAASLSWMTKNLHRYKPDKQSAVLIANYIRNSRLPWTEDSIERAFNALVKDKQIEEQENDEPEPIQPAPPVTPVPAAIVPPWTSPITKASVRAMSAQGMKTYLGDRKWGKQFEQEIRNLKVTKGDIRP